MSENLFFPISDLSSSYTLKDALLFARLSLLAYSDESAIRKKLQGTQYSLDLFVESSYVKDTQAMICSTEDSVIVAFRGTSSFKDALVDLDTDEKTVSFMSGRVHHGFKTALDSVYDEIKTVVDEISKTKKNVWVTGHSLGAALASLFTARYGIEDDQKISACYNFGSPRIGNSSFAKMYDKHFRLNTFRHVNNSDIVPRVPPALMQYRHVGSLRYIDTKNRIHSRLGGWRLYLDRFKERVLKLANLHVASLEDHKCGEYIKHLESGR